MTEFNEGDKVRVISEHTLNGVGGTSFFDTSHIASWEPA